MDGDLFSKICRCQICHFDIFLWFDILYKKFRRIIEVITKCQDEKIDEKLGKLMRNPFLEKLETISSRNNDKFCIEADITATDSLRATSAVAPYEKSFLLADGTDVSVILSGAWYTKKQDFIGVVADVGPMKIAEKRAQESLRAKSQFIANVSHGEFSTKFHLSEFWKKIVWKQYFFVFS